MSKTKVDSKKVMELLNATIESFNTVLPFTLETDKPYLLASNTIEPEMAVTIEMVGDVSGSLLIKGESTTFSSISEGMYGMALDGDMLSSFTGELGNMIGGNICTVVSQSGTTMDITPPKIISEKTSISNFERGLCLNVNIEAKGELKVCLLL